MADGDGPPTWIIRYTIATSLGSFIIFGQDVLDLDSGSCTGLVSCTSFVFDFLGAFFILISGGAILVELTGWMAALHLLVMAIGYGPWVYRSIIEAVKAVNPL